ncbi:MAG: MBL fold metallo-hydrolase [Actinomycetes bacterium]
MKLTIVGFSGSFAGPESPASCYLVEHEGTRVLFDIGNGALGALAQYVDIYSIDAVVLSHLHADHCADLAGFYVARKYGEDGPMPSIPVFGPRGTAARMAALYGTDSGSSMDEIFDFAEFDADPFRVGSLTLTAHPVVHCVPGFALRAQADGRSVIYSGDTAFCSELVEASRGADLALFEASYLSRRSNAPGIHMTGTDCAKAATAAGIEHLILTHLVPWNDQDEVFAEADSAFDGDVRLAVLGLEEEI